MNSTESEKEMPFLGHLEELRWRLVRSAVAISLIAILIFIFTEQLVNQVFIAMSKTNFPTYRFFCWVSKKLGMGDTLCASKIELSLQSTEMMGQFSTNMYLALIGGIVVSFPFIFHQMWGFLKPGLKEHELKHSNGLVFYGSFLFFSGVAFGYFLISPLCVQFFGNYKMAASIANDFKINSYLSIISTSTFFCGLLFELPVIAYILSKIGIIDATFLKKYRRHAIVVILILSAIITPPDFISQVIVSVPILILYEIAIFVSKRATRRRK